MYDPAAPLDRASTIPAPWYTDERIVALERRAVFAHSWQVVARVDQLREPGDFVTSVVAGEPVVVVRTEQGDLRAFFNVCRHHAAAVATEPQGKCNSFQCPYHGWTYELSGALRTTPDFDGALDFDKSENGLVPIAVTTWENFVLVNLNADPAPGGARLDDAWSDVVARVAKLELGTLRFFERRSYVLDCNWKVYVDNYLDGGYHVPYAHKSLNTVVDYKEYQIECFANSVRQWSPMRVGRDAETAALRGGQVANYWWIYPNFMINWYEGVMDTNLVVPLGVDRCEVVFDFYFNDVSEAAGKRNRRSIDVGERVQNEDVGLCEAVQRGLGSRAYVSGRLSPRREAGEQLFHRLLHRDLSSAALHEANG